MEEFLNSDAFFVYFLLGAELHAKQRAGTSAAQSPASLASSVGVVALFAGLGFHLEMGLDSFCRVTLWDDSQVSCPLWTDDLCQ